MNRTTGRAALALAAMGIALAVAGSGVAGANPVATLVFAKDYKASIMPIGFSSASQTYLLFETPTCTEMRTAADFSRMSGNEKTLKIQAERRIVIDASTVLMRAYRGDKPTAGMEVQDAWRERCRDSVSFTPEKGHAYDVVQPTTSGSCALRVVDRVTGAEPASIVRIPGGTCPAYFAADRAAKAN